MGSPGPISSRGEAGSPRLEEKETHGKSPSGITPTSISLPGQEALHQLTPGTPDTTGGDLCRVSLPSDEEANDCVPPRHSPVLAHPPLLGHPFPQGNISAGSAMPSPPLPAHGAATVSSQRAVPSSLADQRLGHPGNASQMKVAE